MIKLKNLYEKVLEYTGGNRSSKGEILKDQIFFASIQQERKFRERSALVENNNVEIEKAC